jgi:PAS domain S-box-containing protein
MASDEAETVDYRAAFEAVPDPALVCAPDGTVREANAAAAALFGESRADLRGRTVGALADGDPADTLRRAAGTGSATSAWRVGSEDVDVSARPAGDAVLAVLRGADESVAQQRRDDAAVLSQITATDDIVFWLFDGAFEHVRFVNGAYEDIFGRPIEQLRADPTDFLEAVHPDDREAVLASMERLSEGEVDEMEYRVNPGEDFGRWVWVRGDPVRGEDGEVERVAGVARDITERKAWEREIERSERRFEAVFNDPQLLVALLDTDGTVRRVNETALAQAGVERDAIEGTPFPETPWWRGDEELQARLAGWLDRAADGEYVEYEAEHPSAGGGTTDVEGTVRPVTDGDGEVGSLIASARDVTERVERTRQLEESNERLEQFAYVASHDLQEPLRTVANYAELLAEEYADELDEEGQRLIDVVVTGSERMQSMIEGLLDYSRVTTRGDPFEPVDSEAVVASVADDLAVLLAEHDGSLTWGDLPTVTADEDQLRQLVQNLVKNALEHSGEAPVEVEVRAEETPTHHRFAVADDGPGIAENRQEKVFRMFKSGKQYQTSSQAKGVGLAVCDNIVQRHDGEIHVESDPGEGATFVFTLPKEPADP